MILLRTSDENGKVQFVTVKNDMFYLECKHCGRIFPMGSICELMEELAVKILRRKSLIGAKNVLTKNVNKKMFFEDADSSKRS